MNSATDAEGVYLGKQLERNLEELNPSPAFAVDQAFECWKFWALGTCLNPVCKNT